MFEALTEAGANVTMEQVVKLIDGVDDDGSGEIEFQEFSEIMETCLEAVPEYAFKVTRHY
jgi:Ca2+-binding EF-hand superfamily protein